MGAPPPNSFEWGLRPQTPSLRRAKPGSAPQAAPARLASALAETFLAAQAAPVCLALLSVGIGCACLLLLYGGGFMFLLFYV